MTAAALAAIDDCCAGVSGSLLTSFSDALCRCGVTAEGEGEEYAGGSSSCTTPFVVGAGGPEEGELSAGKKFTRIFFS